MEKQKRVLAIHDISCIGKCSLTAALPIISAAGIETAVIPTAVLSTHTGGFENFTYRDLTDDILPIARHWQSLGIEFDAIYTGFLGSEKQVDIVLEVFNIFGSSCLKFVDPAMADVIPIDCISVSRISHPSDRFTLGQTIQAVVTSVSDFRIGLSHKELLGTWMENAAKFAVGETVSGIVRSMERELCWQ